MLCLRLIFFIIVARGSLIEDIRQWTSGEERKSLKWFLNPGCGDVCKNGSVSLSDIGKEGSRFRWMWDVSDMPGFYSVYTQANNDPLKVNWPEYLKNKKSNGSLEYVSGLPIYASAVFIENILEFNDTKDDVKLNYTRCEEKDLGYCVKYPMHSYHWNMSLITNTSYLLQLQYVNDVTLIGRRFTSGKINITVSAFGEDGYGKWLPHLLHNHQTSEVDIKLDGIKTRSNFKNSRFALEFVIVSSARNKIFTRIKSTTLNDEHTPGIFTTEEVLMPVENSTLKSYLQWRPVVYTKPHRALSDSGDVFVSKGVKVKNIMKTLRRTPLYALFGKSLNNFSVERLYTTFGTPKDGFYKKTRYDAWTFVLGNGSPIEGGISSSILLASFIMFAVVLISMLASGIFCIVRRWRVEPDAPQFSYVQI